MTAMTMAMTRKERNMVIPLDAAVVVVAFYFYFSSTTMAILS
jgi:hypothetical protein